MRPSLKTFLKTMQIKSAALLVAAAIWLPCLHFFYKPDPAEYRSSTGVAPKARMLAARHIRLWTDPDSRERELAKMQSRNPEWDFMSRTFFVLSLANMALRDPSYRQQACEIIDLIVDHTLKLEREKGLHHFLLGYAHEGRWTVQPARSIFVDGEIALMLAARRFVEERPAYAAPLSQRVTIMIERMRQSPVLCAESYPDECWLFCNTVALAAIRMADVLDGTDHSTFLAEWVRTAEEKLIEPTTGILISSFAVHGEPAPCGFGPEGSTIWMAAHLLEIVDRDLASDQYRRARKELARSFVGFGYAREWPVSCAGPADVDSGPIVPLLGASASSSGLAILAAAAFDDRSFLTGLLASLNFVGFPVERDGQLRYCASNPVGDAVLLYAMVLGPLWDEVERRSKT